MDEVKYCDESESSYDMVDAVESVGMSRNALFLSSRKKDAPLAGYQSCCYPRLSPVIPSLTGFCEHMGRGLMTDRRRTVHLVSMIDRLSIIIIHDASSAICETIPLTKYLYHQHTAQPVRIERGIANEVFALLSERVTLKQLT